MKILHILAGGDIGGIEILCKDYAKFSQHENIFVILWRSGVIAEEMKKSGFQVIELNAKKKEIMQTAYRLCTICKEKGINAVIVHHAAPMSHIYMHIIKKSINNVKTIAYAHGNAADMCRSKDKKGLFFRKKVLEQSLKRVDIVVAISNSVKESLINYFGIPSSKIEVIYNGVDTKKFLSDECHRFMKPVNIIYVGRLIEEKGVQITLHALALVKDRIAFDFKVVGEGKYKDTLKTLAVKLGINNRVEFLGNRRNVPELLSKSDIFVHMPVWEEGFGITVIEAMASGNVCICADSGALSEIIENGKNGFIVPKEGINELSDLLFFVINKVSSEKIREIKAAAICRASDFSLTIFVKRLDKVLSFGGK